MQQKPRPTIWAGPLDRRDEAAKPPPVVPQLRIDPTIEGDSTNAQDARDCREAEKGRLERPFDFQQISLTEENRQTNENP